LLFFVTNFPSVRITSVDTNLLVQHAFPNAQYPVVPLTADAGYLLLLRAFEWVHQPHSLASLQKYASESWLLTRPSLDHDEPVDTSADACANRLLDIHYDTRSILDLYPTFAKDPALISEYLLSIGLYDRNTMPTCYGLQLTVIASCLVAHLQDECATTVIDQYLSLFDLLFILSAGGVYRGSMGLSRTFTSDLFPVYDSVTAFMTLQPRLLNMDYAVLTLSLLSP